MARPTPPWRPLSQPYDYLEIDWSHELSDRLAFFIVQSGGNFYDLVNDARGTKNGSAAIADFKGRTGDAAAKLASATSDYYAFADVTPYHITGDISLLWSGIINTGSAYRSFAMKGLGGGGTNAPFDFRTDNSAVPKIALVRSNAGSVSLNVTATSGTLSLGVPHQAGVSSVVSTGAVAMYRDGINTDNFAVGGYTVTADTTNLKVGRRTDGVVQMDGFTEFVIGWSRSLSASEFRELWDNPYQLVRVDQRRLYFGAAAGGGSIGAASGVSTAQAIQGYIGGASGVSTVSGLSATGSIGTASGTSTAQAIAGFIARASGVAADAAIAGYIAKAIGTATDAGRSGSVGHASGSAVDQAIVGFIGHALGSSIVSGASGGTGSAGSAVGVSVARAIAGYIGAARGLSIATGATPFAQGVGTAAGLSTATAIPLGSPDTIAVPPIPIQCVTSGEVTPAMRQWMTQMMLAVQSASTLATAVARKGDLWTYSTKNDRLAAPFADGDVLTSDSTQPTGLAWKTLASALNVGANGTVLTADSTQPSGMAWDAMSTKSFLVFNPAAGTSGNWTVPAGVYVVWITAIGGGGAGSTVATTTPGGGGGGAGEYQVRVPYYVTPGASIAYAVGAKGVGVTTAGTGANGGLTSFGPYSLAGGHGGASSGVGGQGGGRLAGAGGATGAPGGAGANATTEGVFTSAGASGGGGGSTVSAVSGAGGACEEFAGGATATGNGSKASGGGGAASPFGSGGAGGAGGAAGGNAPATAYGGGGGGGGNSNVSKAGDGADGFLAVEYFA